MLRSRDARSEVIRWALRAGVFPPDVQHENRSNEKQTHHQHWHWAAVTTKETLINTQTQNAIISCNRNQSESLSEVADFIDESRKQGGTLISEGGSEWGMGRGVHL